MFNGTKWEIIYRVLFETDKYCRERSEHLNEYYSEDMPKLPLKGKKVIFRVDGWGGFNCGLSDKLRGLVFVYNCVRELKMSGHDIDFCINFTKPFNLADYLVPNQYDWRIDPQEISHNSTQAEPIHTLSRTKPGFLGFNKHKSYIKSRFKRSKCNQIHVRSNLRDRHNKLFSQGFDELFKPSERLQKALDVHCQALSIEGYISASFRFMDLLGDFNEGLGRTLDDNEKVLLMSRCVRQLEQLHTRHPKQKILVTSDSGSFLKYAATKLPYVYIVEGDITHVGHSSDSSFELHLKTFVDLLMIARAEKVYLLRTGEMYKSGFSKSASRIYNTEFEYIKF